MEEKDLLQSKQFLFERSKKNNRCCYVLFSQCLHFMCCTSSAEAYRCCVRLSSCQPFPEAGRDRQAYPRYLGIEGFIFECQAIFHVSLKFPSFTVPGHIRHEPIPSQTKQHVAQRVRPSRKNNPSKKTSKKWISKNLFIPLQAQISPRQHG